MSQVQLKDTSTPININVCWSEPFIVLGSANTGTLEIVSLTPGDELVISKGDYVQLEAFHLTGWQLTVTNPNLWQIKTVSNGYQLVYLGSSAITISNSSMSAPSDPVNIGLTLTFPSDASLINMVVQVFDGSGNALTNPARMNLNTVEPQAPFSAFALAPALVILTSNSDVDFPNDINCQLANHSSDTVNSVSVTMVLIAEDADGNTVDISQSLGDVSVKSESLNWSYNSAEQDWSYTFDTVDKGIPIDVEINGLKLPQSNIAIVIAQFKVAISEQSPYLTDAIFQAFGPYSLALQLDDSKNDALWYQVTSPSAGVYDINPINSQLNQPPLQPQILDANNNVVYPPIPAWFSWEKDSIEFPSAYALSSGNNPLYLVTQSNGGFSAMTNTTVNLDFFPQAIQAADVQQNYSSDQNNPQFGSVMPSGAIMMWSGTDIPAGWALCDGSTVTLADGSQKTTPDLKDKFVLGADTSSVNTNGEGDSHSHTFSLDTTFTTSSDGTHNHLMPSGWYNRGLSCGDWSGVDCDAQNVSTATTQDNGEHSHTVEVTFTNISTSTQGPLRPPWYALCFIMKL